MAFIFLLADLCIDPLWRVWTRKWPLPRQTQTPTLPPSMPGRPSMQIWGPSFQSPEGDRWQYKSLPGPRSPLSAGDWGSGGQPEALYPKTTSSGCYDRKLKEAGRVVTWLPSYHPPMAYPLPLPTSPQSPYDSGDRRLPSRRYVCAWNHPRISIKQYTSKQIAKWGYFNFPQ